MIAALPLISSALSLLTSNDTATSAVKAAATSGSGADFGQVLSKLSSEAVNNVKKAESLSVDGIAGKADIQSVVQSVMTAQESLQTALAIRDKAVAAFQEVTRMAI